MILYNKFLIHEQNIYINLTFSDGELKIIGELLNDCNSFQAAVILLYNNLTDTYFENKIFEEGFLYCLWNEIYAFYGTDFYKLGCTKNPDDRLRNFSTPYPCDSLMKIVTGKIKHHTLAEKILFQLLSEYRLTNNREFFKCDLEIIKQKMIEVEEIMQTMTIKNILQKYNMCAKYEQMFQKFLERFFAIPEIGTLTNCKFLDKLSISIVYKPQYWDKLRTLNSLTDLQKLIEFNNSVEEIEDKSSVIHVFEKMKLCNVTLDIIKLLKLEDIFSSNLTFKKYLSFVSLISNINEYDNNIKDKKRKFSRITLNKSIINKIMFCHEIEKILNIGIMEVVIDPQRSRTVIEDKDFASHGILANYRKNFPKATRKTKLVYWTDYYCLLETCYANLMEGLFIIRKKQKQVKYGRSYVIDNVIIDNELIKKFLILYKYHYGDYSWIDKNFAKRFDIA